MGKFVQGNPRKMGFLSVFPLNLYFSTFPSLTEHSHHIKIAFLNRNRIESSCVKFHDCKLENYCFDRHLMMGSNFDRMSQKVHSDR